MRATCYHFRNKNGTKVLGGSLSGSVARDLNAAAEEIIARLGVAVTNGGRVHFVRNGQEVFVYLSVDASETERGRAALEDWRKAREAEACPCCGMQH